MKLAVSTYSLWRWENENKKTPEDALAWIAECGEPRVEFAGFRNTPEEQAVARAAEMRKLCDKLKLTIVGYCIGAELLVPADKQKAAVATLKKHVDAAAELGAKTMRHDVTRGWGDYSSDLKVEQTVDNAIRHIVPAIREVCDYAAKKGIKTSLENHGFYMQAAERVEKLIQAVNHPNYGLTIDLGNFLCVNDDPTAAVQRLSKYVIMAHAKDFHVRPKDRMPPTGWFATPTEIALRGAIAGHGVLDLPKQLQLLKQAGYDGWLSLEFEGMEEPASAIKLGLDYLRKEIAKL